MNNSLVIRVAGGWADHGKAMLCLRSIDCDQPHYDRILTFPAEYAHGITSGNNGITWNREHTAPNERPMGQAEPISLRIKLRDDPKPECHFWEVHADDAEGSRLLGYISSASASNINYLTGGINFEGGAPDWLAEKRMSTEMQVLSLRAKASMLLAKADAMEASLMQSAPDAETEDTLSL